MLESNQREQDIFNECLCITPGQRSAYLKIACEADSELLFRVERLLAAHLRAERTGDDQFDCIARCLAAELDVDTRERAFAPSGILTLGDAAEQRAGDTIGSWRLLRKIGEGGMASVWLAECSDNLPGPRAAIKLPHGDWPRRFLVERMALERDVLATLTHSNIARLLEAGLTAGGQPYLALEYIEGKPINEYCKLHEMSVAMRVELFLHVTAAISYAHNSLVVHRDLKPSNILVTESGGVRVLDFGIAKRLEADATRETELTRYSGPVLTLDYASPEQVLGKPLTVASDLYSLGVILYELLTGARPYRHKCSSRAALEDAILTEEPHRPSDVVTDSVQRRQLQGDLDTIVLKALKKEVGARYSTVESFAEDLRRYLQNRPVIARPDKKFYRFAKFVRRHRIGAAALAAVVIVLFIASITVVWQVRITLAQKERAETAKAFLLSILLDAHSYWGSGKPRSAVDLLRNAQARISARTLPDTASRVEVLNIVGAGLLSQHDMREAEAVINRAVQDAAALPERHPMALRARMLKDWVFLYRGQIAKVRSEIDGLLGDMKRAPATLPEDLAGAHRIRSAAALEAGDNAVAESDALEALRIAETRLNSRHNQAVLALVDLCYAQLAQGDPAARQTGERALARALEAYGGSYTHPNVLKARVARAQTLAENGELEIAIDETNRAIKDAADLFGPSARVIGIDLLRLARLQLRVGHVRSALASVERAKGILIGCLDPSAAGYASLLEVRGSALVHAGRFQEADVDLNGAEQLLRNSFGPAHPSIARIHKLLRVSAASSGTH